MTPKDWTRGAIRSRIGASNQRLFRIRGLLIEHAKTEGANIGPDIEALGDFLKDEYEWIGSMQPVPDGLTRTDRASFLASYARTIDETATALTTAVSKATGTGVVAEDWEPVGVCLLQVLAHGKSVRQVR